MSVRFGRREVLRLTLAAGAVGLTGCRGGGTDPTSTPTPSASTVTPSAGNPYGVVPGSQAQLLGSELDFGADALTSVRTLLADATVPVQVRQATSATIAATVLPQLVQQSADSQTPPDALFSSGIDGLSLAELSGRTADLATVLSTSGAKLVTGARDAGSRERTVLALPYLRDVRGLWYSSALFQQHGWQPPATWDGLRSLGLAARSHGMYLFVRGREASLDLARMVAGSAIKQGGDEVRTALESLAEGFWSLDPVQQALTQLAAIVGDGLVRPGGTNDTGADALARWARDQDCVLYPGGASVGWRVRDLVRNTFAIALAPEPSLDAAPALGATAAHVGFTGWLAVPTRAANRPGGLAIVDAALEPEAARVFSTEHFVLSTVAGVEGSPTSEHGRAALTAQTSVLDAAGDGTYAWQAVERYGLGPDLSVLFAAFLDQDLGQKALTAELQALTDRVRNDPDIPDFPTT